MRRPLLFRRWLCHCLLLGGFGVLVPLLASAPAFSFAAGELPCNATPLPVFDEAALDRLEFADWPLEDPAKSCPGVRKLSNDSATATVISLAPPADEDQPRGPFGAQILALDSTLLDDVRGGFEPVGSHFSLSFGIERAVYINGELVATTVLNLKDLQVSGGAGASAAVALPAGSTGALGIIQNGAGNDVSTRISAGLAGTIIQNTLNDQKIQNVTTINATVNSLQVMRSISVQTAVQDGIVNSLRR